MKIVSWLCYSTRDSMYNRRLHMSVSYCSWSASELLLLGSNCERSSALALRRTDAST